MTDGVWHSNLIPVVERETSFSSKPFLVMGMHRSGTSAVTRVLNLLGLRLPRDLLSPAKSNELGFWEGREVVALNDNILLGLNRDWADPKPLPTAWHTWPRARNDI